MTQKELEAYDKEMQEKGWLGQMWMMFPAGWRWGAGFKGLFYSDYRQV